MYGAWLAPGTCLPPMTQYFFTVFIHIVLARSYYAYSCPYIFYELVYTVVRY